MLLAGVEVKNSLDRTTKSDRSEKMDKFRLYSFPVIAADPAFNWEKQIKKTDDFHQSKIDGMKGNNTGLIKNTNGFNELNDSKRDKATEIEAQAYLDGFTKGEIAGVKIGKEKFQHVFKNIQQAIKKLETAKKEIYLNAEKGAVELALAIARKIVCREVSTNRDIVLSIFKKALEEIDGQEKIRIKMSPSDIRLIKDAELEWAESVGNIESIDFEADKNINNGGCIIETNLGEIDARIEKQLQVVEEAFELELQRL